MKRFIITISLGIVVLGFASGSRAEVSSESNPVKTAKAAPVVRQAPYDPHADFGRFAKDLTLTKEQQEGIKPLLEKLDKELLPLRKLTYQRLGQRGAPIVRNYYQKIRESLETEQVGKFNEMVDKGMITPFIR